MFSRLLTTTKLCHRTTLLSPRSRTLSGEGSNILIPSALRGSDPALPLRSGRSGPGRPRCWVSLSIATAHRLYLVFHCYCFANSWSLWAAGPRTLIRCCLISGHFVPFPKLKGISPECWKSRAIARLLSIHRLLTNFPSPIESFPCFQGQGGAPLRRRKQDGVEHWRKQHDITRWYSRAIVESSNRPFVILLPTILHFPFRAAAPSILH